MQPPEGYRPGVGLMLLDRRGRAFLGRRADMAGEIWQMPQGGIEPGESPHAAALRELEEEVGTRSALILAESHDWLCYELPSELAASRWEGRYRGQAQRWFALGFEGSDSEIDLAAHARPEFDAWRWAELDELAALSIAFKRAVYTRVVEEFRPIALGRARLLKAVGRTHGAQRGEAERRTGPEVEVGAGVTDPGRMAELEIVQFPCLQDNYGYLIHDPGSGQTAVIDTPEVAPIERALAEHGWRLTHIFNTHWHPDHAGGNQALKDSTGCTVIGPRAEAGKIPGIDRAVGDGDVVALGGQSARVFDVPGHTAGHIAYWFEGSRAAFVGDTIFALGCGRLFEGTAAQMWSSLQKLMALPPDTRIYCAHEYTQSNARFALSVEPENADLVARARRVDELRARGAPTVPSTLGEELRTNPFLRAASPALQRNLGMVGAPLDEVFGETRRRKDVF